MSDRERAIAALEKAGFRPLESSTRRWSREVNRPSDDRVDYVTVHDDALCHYEQVSSLSDLPSIISPSWTLEMVNSITYAVLSNGYMSPGGAKVVTEEIIDRLRQQMGGNDRG